MIMTSVLFPLKLEYETYQTSCFYDWNGIKETHPMVNSLFKVVSERTVCTAQQYRVIQLVYQESYIPTDWHHQSFKMFGRTNLATHITLFSYAQNCMNFNSVQFIGQFYQSTYTKSAISHITWVMTCLSSLVLSIVCPLLFEALMKLV